MHAALMDGVHQRALGRVMAEEDWVRAWLGCGHGGLSYAVVGVIRNPNTRSTARNNRASPRVHWRGCSGERLTNTPFAHRMTTGHIPRPRRFLTVPPPRRHMFDPRLQGGTPP